MTGPESQCEYDGQVFPYPGDCHKYFRCRELMKKLGYGASDFAVDVFTCGEWIFDPNQGSCVWPEIDNDLCPPE